jgi:hypothetical protein
MIVGKINPFSSESYQAWKVHSSRDFMLLGIESALLRMHQTFSDITDEEFNWEPLSETERAEDIKLPTVGKRVWRVFQEKGIYTYY